MRCRVRGRSEAAFGNERGRNANRPLGQSEGPVRVVSEYRPSAVCERAAPRGGSKNETEGKCESYGLHDEEYSEDSSSHHECICYFRRAGSSCQDSLTNRARGTRRRSRRPRPRSTAATGVATAACSYLSEATRRLHRMGRDRRELHS